MRLDYLTIFPDYLAPLRLSLPGKAIESGLLEMHVHDLRAWAHDKHRTVDDTPYGGGAGMVMKPEPFGEAFDELAIDGATVVVTTPSGEPMTQALARELSSRERLVFLLGRYEGIDQRVLDHAATRAEVREISLGDYVLNGGEVAAMAITEAVVRLLPGFMGNAESLVEESHEDGLLEYPGYTKPSSWRDLEVPKVLLSGDHKRIAQWRHEQAVERTSLRRPDLLHASQAAGLGEGSEWEIVPAVRADAAELHTLQLACWVQELNANPGIEIPPLHESLDDTLRALETHDVYVVRAAGRLVGSVRGRLDGDVWEIGRLMSAPDLQGRGLGRRLFEHIQAVAPAGARSFRLFTGARSERNLKLYKKAGFRLRRDLEAPTGAVILTKNRGSRR
ncbi:tRNA (guanine37-N(1)-) methyltransferase [Nocardioides albertanoniae]|uniref:tRNA (guanine-N(1)-)-methyltransferase n=1 Tax=Nocardioides albertanoniae TaxID=1175486 RepID=A0A543A9U5_9ACTN|nr:tRNA (guanosine(37)-N1)-methyltransferase TrmD [Nocardioides albertanoniae]TQL69384.1 tRNA (guanine37-N(1)-) methyltransferase [Nocardioides albertanoniae]